ncbi:hypothetical protein F5050DRAFT_765942 [Lentinula boryana]|uniref:Uncharacterized protein n=1 Tax=Lentinula boryana TaxID=40481 RepID=A0ABQ8Q517_9AGAR|nr:hypothetical protein F5050DRAFT_765942 [Lentinula boryana]
MRLTPTKAYVLLNLAMTIHALALPRSQNNVKEILVEARAYGLNAYAPPYPVPSISNSKPWPKVTPDSKDPNIYVVYSNIKREGSSHFRATSDTLVHNFLDLSQVRNELKLGGSYDFKFMRYPDSDVDKENLHFSIVGPSVCGVRRRQCTVLLNRKSPNEKYWIMNEDGEIIEPVSKLYMMKDKCVLVTQRIPESMARCFAKVSEFRSLRCLFQSKGSQVRRWREGSPEVFTSPSGQDRVELGPVSKNEVHTLSRSLSRWRGRSFLHYRS